MLAICLRAEDAQEVQTYRVAIYSSQTTACYKPGLYSEFSFRNFWLSMRPNPMLVEY